jgi:uncharacterized membrane protein YkvA (DUF1232 family)
LTILDDGMALVNRLKERARALKQETYALYLVTRDPRTPWYAKVLAAAVVAYAFSPIDLIPDFVPVLGYLDDLIIVPAGIALVLRLVPDEVLADCRERARVQADRPVSRLGAAIVIAVWSLIGVLLVLLVRDLLD